MSVDGEVIQKPIQVRGYLAQLVAEQRMTVVEHIEAPLGRQVAQIACMAIRVGDEQIEDETPAAKEGRSLTTSLGLIGGSRSLGSAKAKVTHPLSPACCPSMMAPGGTGRPRSWPMRLATYSLATKYGCSGEFRLA
jgi:hypothetical protein